MPRYPGAVFVACAALPLGLEAPPYAYPSLVPYTCLDTQPLNQYASPLLVALGPYICHMPLLDTQPINQYASPLLVADIGIGTIGILPPPPLQRLSSLHYTAFTNSRCREI